MVKLLPERSAGEKLTCVRPVRSVKVMPPVKMFATSAFLHPRSAASVRYTAQSSLSAVFDTGVHVSFESLLSMDGGTFYVYINSHHVSIRGSLRLIRAAAWRFLMRPPRSTRTARQAGPPVACGLGGCADAFYNGYYDEPSFISSQNGSWSI